MASMHCSTTTLGCSHEYRAAAQRGAAARAMCGARLFPPPRRPAQLHPSIIAHMFGLRASGERRAGALGCLVPSRGR